MSSLKVFSVGQIAKRLGKATHQIDHIIDSRGISPIGKVGPTRAYDEAAVKQIEAELAEQERRRQRQSFEGSAGRA